MNLIIEELNKNTHNRQLFDCGVEPLNTFLKLHANQNQQKNISKTFVAVLSQDNQNPKTIISYYTLSSGQLLLDQLPAAMQTTLPKHPVPIARIARLAVDKNHHGQGVGSYLLYHALNTILDISKKIGIYAVVVDAKDNTAKSFYKKYGFAALHESELTLFLPMTTLKSVHEN